MKPRQFIPVLIIAAGIWAYHNSFHGPFIFDDISSIPDNPHIRHLWPLYRAMSAPVNSTVDGRPVVCLSLAGNYAAGGLNVRGYHAFNLAVHLLSALVLFGVARRTLEEGSFRDRLGAAAVWLAAAITLIWEVHPLQTESVTYVVQRTELLMGLFLLLTLYSTLRGSRSDRPRAWYLLAVVSCAVGMGCKEVMVSAPLVVLLYDRVFLASSFRELWRKRAGLYLGLAATWLLLAVLVAGTPRRATGFAFGNLTPCEYLMTETGVILYYLRLCLWPHPLVIDYFGWPVARSLDDVLLPGIVVVGLLGATVWAFRRRPWLGFLGAWFFLILAPTSSFLPSAGEVAAERRMYLPLAAVVTITVIGAFEIGKRVLDKRRGVALGCVAVASVVVLFTLLTIRRNQDYRSDAVIWQDAVQKSPANPRAHDNLGIALTRQGRLPEAISHLEQALRINPDDAEAHTNLGVALVRQNKLTEAIGHYERALQINPDLTEAHYNLGLALMKQGRVTEAINHYEQALRINPNLAEAHNTLGLALMRQGRLPEAIGQYEQGVRLKPDDPSAHNHFGDALARAGRVREAIRQYEEALRIEPDAVETQNNLAWLLATSAPEDGGNPTQGLRLAQRVCELTRDQVAPYLDTLAAAYAATGQFSEAVATARRAMELASAAKQPKLAEEIRTRLELYRHGRVYRQSVGGDLSERPSQ